MRGTWESGSAWLTPSTSSRTRSTWASGEPGVVGHYSSPRPRSWSRADRPGLQWNLRRPGFRAHRLRSDRLCVHAHRALPDRGRDHRRSRLSDESHSPGAGKIAGTGNRGVSMTRRAVPPGSVGGELEGLADPSVAPCLARQSRLWTLDQRVTSSAEPGSSVLIHDA